MKNFAKKIVVLCTFALSLSAWAGAATSLMQTAPVLAPETFQLTLQGDVIFNRGGGLNLSPHFRTGLVEHYLDIDAFIATGKTQFQTGTMLKYNFLPDIEGQVGLAFLLGGTFIRDDFRESTNKNMFLLSTGILVSKNLAVEFGQIAPYGAFMFESLFAPSDSYAPLSILAGAKWSPNEVTPWEFYSEFSVSIKDSLNMLAVGASFQFE